MQHKIITILFSFILSSSACNVVAASALDDAVEAMRSGDFAEAYCIMRPLADAGDVDAQYNIGWMYLNGYGLRVNENLALEWWGKASEQGHADASFSIGMLYSLGDGEVPKNENTAIDYYLHAVESGQEDAVAILQSMMLRNDPVMRKRLHAIVNQHAALFGIERKVKARKLNARKGPTTEDKVVTRLLEGQLVLEMLKRDSWSQVVVLDNEEIDRTVWVYNPLLIDYMEPDNLELDDIKLDNLEPDNLEPDNLGLDNLELDNSGLDNIEPDNSKSIIKSDNSESIIKSDY